MLDSVHNHGEGGSRRNSRIPGGKQLRALPDSVIIPSDVVFDQQVMGIREEIGGIINLVDSFAGVIADLIG